GKVHGPGVEQGLDNAQIFPQVAQGGAEVGPIGLLHPGAAAGPQPQAEAPWRELRQHLHLLHHRYGVAWKGLRDGRPEQHVLRTQGGPGEDTEGIGATGSGAREPRRRDTSLLQIGDAGQDGGTFGSRYDYTKSFLGHLITSHTHACMVSVSSDSWNDSQTHGLDGWLRV